MSFFFFLKLILETIINTTYLKSTATNLLSIPIKPHLSTFWHGVRALSEVIVNTVSDVKYSCSTHKQGQVSSYHAAPQANIKTSSI